MKILQLIKKGSALFLAVFLLITSTGVELNAHYCKTKLVSISIWSEAQSCSQTTETDETPNTQTSVSKQNCCNSKTVFNKTEIESEVSLLKAKPLSSYFSTKVFTIPLVLTEVYVKSVGNYSPPLNFDRPILYQNFRI